MFQEEVDQHLVYQQHWCKALNNSKVATLIHSSLLCCLMLQAAKNIESDQEIPNSPSLPVTMRSPDAVPSDKDENLKNLTSTEPLVR